MGCRRKDTNETSVCSQDIWEFSMSPAAATVSNCGASDSDVSALCIRFVRKKKELLRCDIATVSPRRSSAKNHVLQELHVVMNRICISTYLNLHMQILMFLYFKLTLIRPGSLTVRHKLLLCMLWPWLLQERQIVVLDLGLLWRGC